MSLPTVKVVLIDDDVEDLELTEDALKLAKRVKFQVTAVSKPEEAVDLMCTGGFDIALLDYQLGPTDGLEVLRKAREKGSQIPVVMLTGHQEDSLAESALVAGVTDYVQKSSLEPALLERTVRYAIERVRVFRELDDAVNRIRFMLDVTPGIAWEADPSGNLQYVSKKWVELVGQEPLGGNLFDPVHPEDRPLAIELWEKAKDTGTEYKAEYRLKMADGNYRWVLSRATRTELHAEASRWIGLTVTVDEQKQLELELQQRVAERTSELVEAQQELEAVSYSMVHDMRSPVRAILASSTEMLMDFPDLTTEIKDGLARQQKVGRRMHALVDGMIQYIRLIRAPLDSTAIDLTQLCEEIRIDLAAKDQLYGAELQIQPEMKLQGDLAISKILISALIENAAKFRRPGLANAIRITQVPGDNGLQIEDTGIGFDEMYVHKAVMPFERLHREDEFPGVGIGLALARRAVSRHGGAIELSSSPGSGTRVKFSFPGQATF